MSAEDFMVIECGKTPQEAFDRAVEQARNEYGGEGYTGTIAEKSSFVIFVSNLPDTQWKKAVQFAMDYEQAPERHKSWAVDVFEIAEDVFGPAAALEIKGSAARELRARFGLKGKKGVRFFVFFGRSPS